MIRARVEEILRLILLELPRAEYQALVPAGLILTGGGANLPGIATLGTDILRLPVRVGKPSALDGIAGHIKRFCKEPRKEGLDAGGRRRPTSPRAVMEM